jgi:large subunit ribosomal protein L4
MPTVTLVSINGDKVGEMELTSGVFGVERNIPLLHQAVIEELANQRAGTADTKTRAEVRGGGRKPYRQKGTGRARQGSTTAPNYPGGGVAWGPHPRSYAQSMPRKMRRLALRQALSAKLADGEMVIVDDIQLGEISTKKMAEILKNIDATGKVLFATTEITEELVKSARNIPGLALRIAPALSVHELIDSDRVVVTKAAAQRLEEAFAQ